MASTINRATLSGWAGCDPEIREIANNRRVARFPLATRDTWKDRSTGEAREKTEWHQIVVLNDYLVDLVEKAVRSGSRLIVEGSLETRHYIDSQGIDRQITEVILGPVKATIELLDPKPVKAGAAKSPSSAPW